MPRRLTVLIAALALLGCGSDADPPDNAIVRAAGKTLEQSRALASVTLPDGAFLVALMNVRDRETSVSGRAVDGTLVRELFADGVAYRKDLAAGVWVRSPRLRAMSVPASGGTLTVTILHFRDSASGLNIPPRGTIVDDP